MDPYLEQHWSDVHTRIASYIADELQPQLTDDLTARLEESIYIEEDDVRELRRPDLAVVATSDWNRSGGGVAIVVATVVEPESAKLTADLPIVLAADPIRQKSIIIYDSAGNRVITAIEIVSPHNKIPGKGLKEYLEKRERFLKSQTNLVEIDLLRTGNWLNMIGPHRPERSQQTTYRVTVVTTDDKLLLYPIPLSARLPVIEIPLRRGDVVPKIDLQKLLDRIYVMGRYHKLNYDVPCDPPFGKVEAAWFAEQRVKPRATGGA